MQEDTISLAGTTRAIVTVLRVLMDVQPDQDDAWERLREQYRSAVAGYDADPSLAGERASFEEIFDMLGIHVTEDAIVVHASTINTLRRTVRQPDPATASPTDGVDDASLY